MPKIKKIYVGTNLVRPRLPSIYQEVEYIQSSGGPYLNLGSFGNVTAGWEIKMNPTASLYKNYEMYLGNSSGHPTAGKIQGRTSGKQIYFQGNGSTDREGKVGDINDTIQTISWTSEGVKNNGTVINSVTPGVWGSGNLWVFNNSGESNYASSMKLYYIKIWADNALVRDCIPCYRKSDTAIGVYDIVNGVFYTNVGSGSFTKGNDV